jgi:tRNA1Val (adenine37-N6)-methyltransferase
VIKIKSKYKDILDVGAGTGILTLMMAQRTSNSNITAVEIDSNSYHQANINIDNCKWNDRINLLHADAKHLKTDDKYDLIICNPPYFSNSKQSIITSKNTARHQVELTLKDLLNIWDKKGNNNSDLACILPNKEAKKLFDMVKNHGNYLVYHLEVR